MRSVQQRHPQVYLNQNVRGMPPSATIAINELSDRLEARGRDVFRFGLGQSPFPVARPVVEALRQHAGEKDYLPVRGLPALREAIAAHHRRTFGAECTGDDVLIGPGSKELMFLLQLVYYGDLVIPTPAWVSYAPQARIIGRKVQELETDAADRWRLMPRALDEHCADDRSRPRIVLLNYPSNPTGASYTDDELAALARVARKYRAIVLSDEIYGRLSYDGEQRSIVRHYPEGAIYSGGLSKWCGAGGWRLGFFIMPRRMRWLLDAMAAVASETYTSTSAPIQHAAITAFEGGPEIDDYLERSRRILSAMARVLVRMLTDAGINVPEPEGGFYLFLDFGPVAERLRERGLSRSKELCEALLKDTGVAVLPGKEFGRPAHELTARLAFVDFDGAAALEASAEETVDDSFVERHCRRTVEGVRRICQWVA